MSEDRRDGWGKLGLVSQIASSLLLPVLLFVASQNYTHHRDLSDQAQRNADRMTAMLGHLSSENPRERLLALQFVEQLAHSNQFPPELVPIVLATAGDSNVTVAKAASQLLTDVVTRDTAAAQSIVLGAQQSVIRRELVARATLFNPQLNRLLYARPLPVTKAAPRSSG